ncbi:MAG: diacylglycerol kinase family lipid kinase [Clostridia bacterium]|nr:diacylglycerol kinase family lipid kinase [Clostridia bacterium]
MNSEKKLLLIANLQAGQKRIGKKLAEVLEVFCKSGYLPTVVCTLYPGHARELAVQHAQDYDIVVCAGGDGTLNETVTGLLSLNKKLPLGYLPCGTTNDLASTLTLSRDLVQAAKDVVEGKKISLDVGLFNKRYFAYTASFGVFTRASYETSQYTKNVLGHLAYLLEGIKDLANLKSVFAKIKTDTEELSGEFLFGAVSNTTSLAGILTIDKSRVLLDDGKFEVLLVDMPRNAIEMSRLLANITQKKYEAPIHLLSSKCIDVETKEPLNWTLDGEFEKGNMKFHIENLHSALTFIIGGRESPPVGEINKVEENAPDNDDAAE